MTQLTLKIIFMYRTHVEQWVVLGFPKIKPKSLRKKTIRRAVDRICCNR